MTKNDVELVVILVETAGPANIGSVARTVAAFGLPSFRLADPRCQVDEESKKWACYGNRVLDKFEYYPDLEAALEDVGLAIAFSRRDGKNRHRHYQLPLLREKILPDLKTGRVALVFGNEESGLKREQLSLCHLSCEIPVVADDGSLNLAHAVTVALYELIGRPTAGVEVPAPKNEHEETAPPHILDNLLERSRETLSKVGYPRHRSTLQEEMVKLETIVRRSGLENWEVRLLLGMMKQVNYRLDHPQ